MTKFRLNARNVFLTYPKCDLPIEDIKFHLLLKKWVKYAIICQEKHQDGSLHAHAVISFCKKVDIKDETYFDINEYHPNIQSVKNLAKSINYLKKDGNYIVYGNEPGTTDSGEKQVIIPDFQPNTTKLEWLTACLENKVPYGYAIALYDELNPATTFNTLLDFDVTHKSRISNFRLQLLEPLLDHLKSYVIVGPSGCGKTTWCKLFSLKPTLMVTHMDDLKSFRINFHKSIIFDDMSFNHLDTVLQIPICDRYDNRSVHCRYSCAYIPAGTQKFFTCNKIPFHTEEPQIARRINLINLY